MTFLLLLRVFPIIWGRRNGIEYHCPPLTYTFHVLYLFLQESFHLVFCDISTLLKLIINYN